MSFALPEALRSYVDQRARSGQYGNTASLFVNGFRETRQIRQRSVCAS